jgi:RHH-type transcriptional regulator, proline utilization regulon repressor / proline dehydrogenase / delta 1-pyrroline-5-carboxylate dehydrogenase
MCATARVRTLAVAQAVRDAGTYCPPALVEIPALDVLRREVFGPVLHIVRYRRDDLGALVDAINALGYGLTLGVHSRIDETIDFVVARARVGNVYVNRNMIGAVVGVQPFGGEGLSGTGPKAGGPLYLERLRRDAIPTLDLAAAAIAAQATAPGFAALRAWAAPQPDRALAQRLDAMAATAPYARVLELPGPTGESNRQSFHARGDVLCTAIAWPEVREQLAAALATGNRVVLCAAARAGLPNDLPRGVLDAISWADAPEVATPHLVLCANARDAAVWRRQLAARDGARVRVVTPVEGNYPLAWLVAERVVSVNTAAAGGNASLMTLGPG